MFSMWRSPARTLCSGADTVSSTAADAENEEGGEEEELAGGRMAAVIEVYEKKGIWKDLGVSVAHKHRHTVMRTRTHAHTCTHTAMPARETEDRVIDGEL